MTTLLILLLKFIAVGIIIHYSTLALFKRMIGYQNEFEDWVWYKRIPFSLLFAYGFLADIFYNAVYAGFFHTYYAVRSGISKPWTLFLPPFYRVRGIKDLHKLTYTKRIQSIIIDAANTNKETTAIGKWALKQATLLNKYDTDHIRFPDNWIVL